VDKLPAPRVAKDIVRRGYDRISTAYRDDVGDTKAGYPLWLNTHLATVGHRSCTRVGDFYGAPMYWSQADAATYCTWLSDAGIDVIEREFIPEAPHGGHELVVGVRRPVGGF
jgi:hypothetical protein